MLTNSGLKMLNASHACVVATEKIITDVFVPAR
jgi:hypothetical protein